MKRKLLLLFVPALLGFTGQAQTVYPDYMDGRIWFKIKDKTPIYHTGWYGNEYGKLAFIKFSIRERNEFNVFGYPIIKTISYGEKR